MLEPSFGYFTFSILFLRASSTAITIITAATEAAAIIIIAVSLMLSTGADATNLKLNLSSGAASPLSINSMISPVVVELSAHLKSKDESVVRFKTERESSDANYFPK